MLALDLSFAQDNGGKLSGVTDNAATGRGASFAYTTSDRVSQAIGPWGEEDYAYDAAGNRTSLETIVGSTTTTETETPDTATNRLTSTSVSGTTTRTLTYRSGGDLYTDAHAGGTAYQYDYDARKRLAEVDQNGTAAGIYGYDYLGRRVWRATTGTGAAQSHYIFSYGDSLLNSAILPTHTLQLEAMFVGGKLSKLLL